MKKILAAVAVTAVCVCALAVAGCGSNSSEFGFTVPDGKLAANGSDMTITLDGNPTTGYEWTASVDGDSLVAGESKYEDSASGKNVTGAGGTYTFTFEGKSAGDSVITLKYARSWESSADDKLITVNVTTNSSGAITDCTATSDGKTIGAAHA